MALNFPASPTTGQVYTPGGGLPSYQWNGAAWLNIGSGSVADSFAYTATGAEAGGGTIVPVTGGYLANLAIVTRNGALQTPGDDVNITSGTNVVFTVPLVAGETIYVLKFRAFGLLDALTKSQNGADILDKPTFRTNIGQTWTEILDQTLVANQTEIIVPLAGYSSFKFDIDVMINGAAGDAALAWQVSTNGGVSYQSGASDYIYEFFRGFGSTAQATGGVSVRGFVTQTWQAASPGVPVLVTGRFFKGDATRTASIKTEYTGLTLGGTEEAGMIHGRTAAVLGAATHLRLHTAAANAIGVGTRITVEAR